MNPKTRIPHILFVLCLALTGTATVSAQGGRGGASGTPGLGRPMPAGGMVADALVPPALNDVEMTDITRAEMQGPLGAAKRKLADARTALTAAIFQTPVATADITAKVQALADAELALALSRADTLAQMQRTMKNITPERRTALVTALSN